MRYLYKVTGYSNIKPPGGGLGIPYLKTIKANSLKKLLKQLENNESYSISYYNKANNYITKYYVNGFFLNENDFLYSELRHIKNKLK